MTTEQLIEKMRSELYDTHFCKQDFEKYDVESVTECCEPFCGKCTRTEPVCIRLVRPRCLDGWKMNRAGCSFSDIPMR